MRPKPTPEPWHLLDLDAQYIVGHETTEQRAKRAAELAALNTGHRIEILYSEKTFEGQMTEEVINLYMATLWKDAREDGIFNA